MVCGLRLCSVVCFLFSVFWASLAFAQEVPVDAEEAMEAAALLYQQQNYAGAAVEFRRAYEIAPFAIFLFNAGRASEQGGNARQAYIYYQQALAVSAEGRRLDPMLSARAEASVHAIGATFSADALAQKLLAQRPIVRDVRWTNRGWVGTGVAATGGVLLATSLGFGRSASSQISSLEGVASESAYNLQVGRIDKTQNIGRALLYGGGALFAVGAGMVIWDLTTVETREFPRVSIVPSSTGFSAVIGGSF